MSGVLLRGTCASSLLRGHPVRCSRHGLPSVDLEVQLCMLCDAPPGPSSEAGLGTRLQLARGLFRWGDVTGTHTDPAHRACQVLGPPRPFPSPDTPVSSTSPQTTWLHDSVMQAPGHRGTLGPSCWAQPAPHWQGAGLSRTGGHRDGGLKEGPGALHSHPLLNTGQGQEGTVVPLMGGTIWGLRWLGRPLLRGPLAQGTLAVVVTPRCMSFCGGHVC